jgi:hypothetical protein
VRKGNQCRAAENLTNVVRFTAADPLCYGLVNWLSSHNRDARIFSRASPDLD